MAASTVEVDGSDDDFYETNSRERPMQHSEEVPSTVIKIKSSQTSNSSVGSISDSDTDLESGDDQQVKDTKPQPVQLEVKQTDRIGSNKKQNGNYNIDSDDELSDKVGNAKPKNARKQKKKTRSSERRKSDKMRSTSQQAINKTDDESDSTMVMHHKHKTDSNPVKSRAKTAPVKRPESRDYPGSRKQTPLGSYRDLLREVLEIDMHSEKGLHSRPSSSSTSSIRSNQSRQKSAIEIPYRWRKNYTFTDERLARIENENWRLLDKIRTCPAEVNKTWYLGGRRFDKRDADEVIRARKMQEIERQNLALLRRLQSIQPSRELRCDVLMSEYNHRQTDFLGGPGNVLWATHQHRTPLTRRPILSQAGKSQLSKLRRRTITEDK